MDQKLKNLTEKLYKEGVTKGNQQAEELIAEAKEKSKEIVVKAEAEARAIVADAEKKAAELEKNTKAELRLSAKQMMGALQQELTNLVSGAIVKQEVSKATDDKNFMQELILAAVSNWAPKQDLLVLVPDGQKNSFEKFFAEKAKIHLDKGLKIESANGIKTGFQIGPVDGSYKVRFTEDDFTEFFKEFVRPKVVEILFDSKK